MIVFIAIVQYMWPSEHKLDILSDVNHHIKISKEELLKEVEFNY